MRKSRSKKHHYLPRHYLAGFTNDDDRFFVYDKHKDSIFISKPDNAFFENNLNTVTFPDGSSSDFLEEMYAFDENQSWGPLDRIRRSTHKTPITLLDKMHLFLFLLFLYWRLPRNMEFVAKLSERAFVDSGEFDFLTLKDKTGQKAPKEIADLLRDSSAFKKTFSQVIPFVPFYKDKEWAAKLENWRFLYTEDDRSWYIVGDNPIIAKGDGEHDFVNCLREFAFPVSGRIALIGLDRPVGACLPREFAIDFDTAIIQEAQRFVACPNKEFLEALVGHYKFHIRYDKEKTIVPELFRMLEQQAE